MKEQKAWRDFEALPPELQQLVVDFISVLRNRYAPTRIKAKRVPLAKEPFIGMWRDREDMADSTAWVRNLRRTEWEQRRARNYSH